MFFRIRSRRAIPDRVRHFLCRQSVRQWRLAGHLPEKILTVNQINVSKKSMNEARNNRYNLLTDFCIKNKILHLDIFFV